MLDRRYTKIWAIVIMLCLYPGLGLAAGKPKVKVAELNVGADWADPTSLGTLCNRINSDGDFECSYTNYTPIGSLVDMNSYTMFWIEGHNAWSFSSAEQALFREYVEGGGFIWADDCNCGSGSAFATSLDAQIKAIWGSSASFQPIPSNHPLLKAYYQLTGLPQANCTSSAILEGFFLGDWLAIARSTNTDVGCGIEGGQEPSIEFGVNAMLYNWDRRFLNLKGRWQMNTGYGLTVPDSSYQKQDGSKPVNGPAWKNSTINDRFENYENDGMCLGFDGIDDYVSVPNLSFFDTNLKQELTVIFWIKPTGTQMTNAGVIDWYYSLSEKSGWKMEYNSNGTQICFTVGKGGNTPSVCTVSQITQNRWYHIAGVVDGSNLRIYVDGEREDEASNLSGDIGVHTRNMYFGRLGADGAKLLKGDIDEVEVYNHAFDPWDVTVSFEDWTYGVSGRWNFDEYDGMGPGSHVFDISNQENHGTIASAAIVESDLDIDQQGADTKYAFACDGDGYLEVNDANSLHVAYVTMEAWVKPATSSGNRIILGKEGEWGIALFDGNVFKSFVDQSNNWYGTTTVPTNDWTHVAASWDGEYLRNYINGELIDTYALPDGWVDFTNSKVGICKKWAPMGSGTGNDANTKLLLHMDGTNGSSSFTDNSASGHTVTANGSASIVTSQSKFGGASGNFDGAGDYLQVGASADFVFGSGDFTIDTWIKIQSNDGYHDRIISNGPDGAAGGWQFIVNSGSHALCFGNSPCSVASASTNLHDNAWHHVAVVRSGTTLRLFVDGNQEASVTDATNYSRNAALIMGAYYDAPNDSGNYLGGMDELRVSKGIARWTANFTPPSTPYGAGINFNDFNGLVENVTVWNHPRDPEEILDRAQYIMKTGWPVAKIKSPPNDYTVTTAQSITFDASDSFDPAGTNKSIVQYLWDFGDGTFQASTANSINHTFTKTGYLPVYLSVQDGDGNFGGTEIYLDVKTGMTMLNYVENITLKAQAAQKQKNISKSQP
jgi:hypothetical protein